MRRAYLPGRRADVVCNQTSPFERGAPSTARQMALCAPGLERCASRSDNLAQRLGQPKRPVLRRALCFSEPEEGPESFGGWPCVP
jgi:hypothetical protein